MEFPLVKSVIISYNETNVTDVITNFRGTQMNTNPIFLSKLSLQSDIPLYSQLVNIIKRNISAGTLPSGALLPSEAELCRIFNISRSTVRQAIGTLETDGLVTRKQGRGTFVAEPKMRRRAENVYSFTSEISAMGMTPSSTILEYDVVTPTAKIINMLEMNGHVTQVYRFTRVRNVDGQPLILETSYYPTYIYPKLTRELLETHSFYSLLYEEGIVPFSALDTYQSVAMSAGEAEILGCRPGACAFSVQRRTRTETGVVYEFTQSLIRADRVKLEISLQREGVTFARSVDT